MTSSLTFHPNTDGTRLVPNVLSQNNQFNRGIRLEPDGKGRKIILPDGKEYCVNPQSLDVILGQIKGTTRLSFASPQALGQRFVQKMTVLQFQEGQNAVFIGSSASQERPTEPSNEETRSEGDAASSSPLTENDRVENEDRDAFENTNSGPTGAVLAPTPSLETHPDPATDRVRSPRERQEDEMFLAYVRAQQETNAAAAPTETAPEQEPATPPEKPKSYSKTAFAVGILALGALALFGAYYFGAFSEPPAPPLPPPAPPPAAPLPPEFSIWDTSTWRWE